MKINPLICPNCGGKIDPSDNVCMFCGTSMVLEYDNEPSEEETDCYGSWTSGSEECAACDNAQTCYDYSHKPKESKSVFEQTIEECIKDRRQSRRESHKMGEPIKQEW